MLFELAGEIDMRNARSLGDCLCQAIDLSPGGLTVDMSAVSFIDSSGIAMMLRVHEAGAAQRRVVIWRDIQPFPAKTLAIVGLDQFFTREG